MHSIRHHAKYIVQDLWHTCFKIGGPIKENAIVAQMHMATTENYTGQWKSSRVNTGLHVNTSGVDSPQFVLSIMNCYPTRWTHEAFYGIKGNQAIRYDAALAGYGSIREAHVTRDTANATTEQPHLLFIFLHCDLLLLWLTFMHCTVLDWLFWIPLGSKKVRNLNVRHIRHFFPFFRTPFASSLRRPITTPIKSAA